nr:hypothetical protein OG296_08940 [Streptomyces sp. NBC_01001]
MNTPRRQVVGPVEARPHHRYTIVTTTKPGDADPIALAPVEPTS